MADNYETMKLRMREAFLQYDQRAMIERFGLRSDGERLYVVFFGEAYAIDRRTGEVSSPRGPANYNEVMTIYDVLCHWDAGGAASGRMVNMNSLSSIQGGSLRREGRGLFGGYAAEFDGRDAALAAACRAMGGVEAGKGDVSFRLPMFDFLPVMIQFWDSADEFPASLELFVDDQILRLMHYETVWFALSHLMARLKERMA